MTQALEWLQFVLAPQVVNGLSIGFVTREDSFDKVTGVRTLKKIDLWEVSIVTFPANPAAQISNVKSAVEALETLAEAERYLRDSGGFSKSAALAFIARVKSMSGRSDSDELGELAALVQRNTALFK